MLSVGSWVLCKFPFYMFDLGVPKWHSDRFGGQKAYIIWKCNIQVMVDVHDITIQQAVL